MSKEVVLGEVSWNDVSGERPSDFMELKEGDNEGRVVSNPVQYAVHWVEDEAGQKRKVNCAVHKCPVCLRGQDKDRPTARWMIKFLDRKDGRVKLLEIGTQILQGIKKLVQNTKHWGPCTEYDINITRGAKGTTPLYSVTPLRHSPLTSEEKQMLSVFNNEVEVSKFVSPLSPEEVLQKLGWDASTTASKSVDNSFQSSKPGSAAPAPGKKPDMDFDF